MERQEKIQRLREEIKKLENRIKKLEHGNRLVPEKSEEYYYILGNSLIDFTVWYDNDYDESRLEIGNVFKTKEDAEFMVERLKVIAELKKFSKPFVYNKKNYYLFLNHDSKKLVTIYNTNCQANNLYFESQDIAKEAIESVGEDRIIKYYFEVNEENGYNSN